MKTCPMWRCFHSGGKGYSQTQKCIPIWDAVSCLEEGVGLGVVENKPAMKMCPIWGRVFMSGGRGEVREEQDKKHERHTKNGMSITRHVADAHEGVYYVSKRQERPPNTKTHPNGRVFCVRWRGNLLKR